MKLKRAIVELTTLRDGLKDGSIQPVESARLVRDAMGLILEIYDIELEYQKLRAEGLTPDAFFADVDRAPLTAADLQMLSDAKRLHHEVCQLLTKKKPKRQPRPT